MTQAADPLHGREMLQGPVGEVPGAMAMRLAPRKLSFLAANVPRVVTRMHTVHGIPPQTPAFRRSIPQARLLALARRPLAIPGPPPLTTATGGGRNERIQ